MAKINLMPWRQERRKARQQQFYTMLVGAAGAGVLLALAGYMYYSIEISGQNNRNAFLQTQIEEVKAKNKEIEELDKKKQNLLARLEVIEKLQADRAKMVHLFDALARSIADGAMITTIKQDGNNLTIQGRAQSNTRVSTYLRSLETSGWMIRPNLDQISLKSGNNALPYEFALCVSLNDPNVKDEEAEADSASTAGPAKPGAKAQPTGATATANTSDAPCTVNLSKSGKRRGK